MASVVLFAIDATINYPHRLFEKRPFELYGVHMGYHLMYFLHARSARPLVPQTPLPTKILARTDAVSQRWHDADLSFRSKLC